MVDQQQLSKLKEQYKKERKGKKNSKCLPVVSLPIYIHIYTKWFFYAWMLSLYLLLVVVIECMLNVVNVRSHIACLIISEFTFSFKQTSGKSIAINQNQLLKALYLGIKKNWHSVSNQ